MHLSRVARRQHRRIVGNRRLPGELQQLKADVALLTERRYLAASAAEDDWYLRNILQEDHLLQTALAELGLSAVRVDWSDKNQDWSAFRCAVFRTTWDYFDRKEEFSSWLDEVQHRTSLCNPAALVRWNMDKRYLADLEDRGVPIVPSRFIDRGTEFSLPEVLRDTGWDEAVIKPCVSGAARHTYRVSPRNASQMDVVVRQLVRSEDLILQPFVKTVLEYGEDSLMIFDGRFSHAVRKRARPGDFRVQDDHGGTVHPLQPSAAQIELAERAIAACRPAAVYGRVDMVRLQHGQYAVMELEVIEPELWLRFHPPAAKAFAEAIAAWLK